MAGGAADGTAQVALAVVAGTSQWRGGCAELLERSCGGDRYKCANGELAVAMNGGRWWWLPWLRMVVVVAGEVRRCGGGCHGGGRRGEN
ncbi:hypothetical protein DEO72_LG8g2603 [Vigna unguiculata]|uniref:Uncharacterized protein n=1 Tax=Vigna unguiculata TaxID=3917 RepID=A0A4D6MXG2_VIGUN|nr:hypothetical protein DEO72_LG8g2603 [Vigna unguiculata]